MKSAFKRVRAWWKPDSRTDMKRAGKDSPEITVGGTQTCDMGESGRMFCMRQSEWYRGNSVSLRDGVLFFSEEAGYEGSGYYKMVIRY